MPRLPVIGISSYARAGDPPSFSLPEGYVDGVRGAGALPIILPPGEPEPERLLDSLDGLILAGGGDVSPQTYGGGPHQALYQVSDERDRFELALVSAALARPALPILCICRGIQVLNVALGGSLHDHVPDRFGHSVTHRLPPRRPTRHRVRIEANSRLAGILGTTDVDVCSWHHQAIDRLGKDLRPVAWAEDGVTEATEHERHPWCVCVQWHPEMQLEEAPHRLLFAALASAAATAPF